MAEKSVIYTYKPEPGHLLPVGVPSHDLTATDIERLSPSALREVKAFAEQGRFFTATTKTAATKAMNAAADKAAAEEGES